MPKFILGDNSEFPDAIFIIHTEFPRFILNLQNDEIEWFEQFEEQDREELLNETESLLKQANDFYDREIALYDTDG